MKSRSCNARPVTLHIPEKKNHTLRKREPVDDVFTSIPKYVLAKALTDVMVKFEGSEAFRQVTWVSMEELHTDGWHIGGEQFAGPRSLIGTLGRSRDVFEMFVGRRHPEMSSPLSCRPSMPPSRWPSSAPRTRAGYVRTKLAFEATRQEQSNAIHRHNPPA